MTPFVGRICSRLFPQTNSSARRPDWLEEMIFSDLNEIDENVIKVKSYKSVYTRRIVGRGEKKTIQISRTVTEFDDFKIGDQVQHNLFGVGTILVLSGSGENQKGHGEKSHL